MVLKFSEKEPPLTKNPSILLKNFPYKLPKPYTLLLKKNDGGSLYYDFDYYDKNFEKTISGGIGVIFGLQCEDGDNLIVRYKKLPDFFPRNLVPFGENGGGNFICFDYRYDSTTDNPPVVYWIHDAEKEKEICTLAKDFEEFLSILREPEENVAYNE